MEESLAGAASVVWESLHDGGKENTQLKYMKQGAIVQII